MEDVIDLEPQAIVSAPQSAPVPSQTPAHLMALAIEHGADVDKLGALMDLQERWDKKLAREAYFQATANFQHDVPAIPLNKVVKNRDGSERYRYAPLDTILFAIKDVAHANGLSWRWEPDKPTDEGTATTCIISHVLGHSERSTVVIRGISGQGTNAAQDDGGVNTYGRRYSLTNALGIQATSDTDAQEVTSGPLGAIMAQIDILRDPMILRIVAAVKEGLHADGDLSAAAEAYALLSKDDIARLWIATTKGGIWTIEERRRIKSDEEFHGMVHAHRTDSDWHARNSA